MIFEKALLTTFVEDDAIFEGIYCPLYNWNGWKMPYFDLETAKKVIATQGDKQNFKDEKYWCSYYELSDVPNGVIEYHQDGIEFYKAIQFEGKDYYPIGYGNWTWAVTKYPSADDYEEENEG